MSTNNNENLRRTAESPLKSDRELRMKGDYCDICKLPTIFGESNQTNPSVVCDSCGLAYHTMCAGVSDYLYFSNIVAKKRPWFCYLCTVNIRYQCEENTVEIDKIKSIVKNHDAEVKRISMELKTVQSKGTSHLQEVEYKMIDSVDKKIEEKITAALQHQVTSIVSDQVQQLINANVISAPSDNQKEDPNRKNIIISCVPEMEDENLKGIIMRIMKQIGYNQDFFDTCFRIYKREFQENQTGAPTIFLKCLTEFSREHIMKTYFRYVKKHPLRPCDIGLEGEYRIYLNEHRNANLQPILERVLELKREGKIEQVSSFSTNIRVKVTRNARPTWIRLFNDNDLNRFLRSLQLH